MNVVNEEGETLPPGHTGRIRAKGPGMLKGFIGEPAGTAEAFKGDWFYSGDLGELTADGQLIHHGRADDMMIFDGINIYPVEIENALLHHPAVAEVSAFSIRSVERGDIPVAAVEIKSKVSEDELRSHCRSWLGAHTPRRLMIVPKIPRNDVGKILKNELVSLFHRWINQRR